MDCPQRRYIFIIEVPTKIFANSPLTQLTTYARAQCPSQIERTYVLQEEDDAGDWDLLPAAAAELEKEIATLEDAADDSRPRWRMGTQSQ